MPARISSSERLGPWIALPFAAFLLLLVAIFSLPRVDCDGGDSGTSAAEIAVTVIACAASVACVAAAIHRIASLHFYGSGVSLAQLGLAAGFVVAVYLVAEAFTDRRDSFVAAFFAAGTLATPLLILALLVGIGFGWRSTDDAGLLLPLYLLMAAVFVYPSFAIFAIGAHNGAFC